MVNYERHCQWRWDIPHYLKLVGAGFFISMYFLLKLEWKCWLLLELSKSLSAHTKLCLPSPSLRRKTVLPLHAPGRALKYTDDFTVWWAIIIVRIAEYPALLGTKNTLARKHIQCRLLLIHQQQDWTRSTLREYEYWQPILEMHHLADIRLTCFLPLFAPFLCAAGLPRGYNRPSLYSPRWEHCHQFHCSSRCTGSCYCRVTAA